MPPTIVRDSLLGRHAPSQPRGFRPESFDVIKRALGGFEQVDDDIDEIDDDPTRSRIRIRSPRWRSLRTSELVDCFSHGLHLPLARAVGNQHVVANLRASEQVEDDNFRAFQFRHQPRGIDREGLRLGCL